MVYRTTKQRIYATDITYKALTTAQPTYLHSLISVQPPRATRSSRALISTSYFKLHTKTRV